MGFLCDLFHQRQIDPFTVEDLLDSYYLQFIERLEHIGFEFALLFGEGRHWSGWVVTGDQNTTRRLFAFDDGEEVADVAAAATVSDS